LTTELLLHVMGLERQCSQVLFATYLNRHKTTLINLNHTCHHHYSCYSAVAADQFLLLLALAEFRKQGQITVTKYQTRVCSMFSLPNNINQDISHIIEWTN